MVYATTGSSWRQGPTQGAQIQNPTNDPALNSLIFLKPETSTSYEVGVKSELFDRRLRLNVDGFIQNYHNLIFPVLNIPIANALNGSVSYNNIAAQGDATVTGIDFDAQYKILPNWSVSGTFNLANGTLNDAAVPCNSSKFNGVPDQGIVTAFPAGSVISFCKENAYTSTAPEWSVVLQSEYNQQITDEMQGYVRGLLNYYPQNGRADVNFVAESYGLLNLYMGVRNDEQGWDVSFFAKNLTDQTTTLSRAFSQQQTTGQFVPAFSSNYYATAVTPRQEFGLNLIYRFGAS